MPNKYLENNAGVLQEVIPAATSTGVGDAGRIVALNAQGEINETMLPSGVGVAVYEIEASQDLAIGDFVNIFVDVTTTKVRKADASSLTTQAHGFVLEAVTEAALAHVYTDFKNNVLDTLTPGQTYFLSTTPGDVAATAPSGDGQIVQRLGVAIDTTKLDVEIGQPIVVATV